MSERYPTCCNCGSAEIETIESVSGERTWKYSAGKERSLENARLIAAAPELLAIAKRVAEHFADTDAPLGIDARAAIAKAEAVQ